MALFNDDLNKVAVTTAKVITLLERLEPNIQSFFDVDDYKDDLFFIAYIIRLGILNKIEKNRWSLMHPIAIPTGLFGFNKTTISAALDLTVGKLKELVKEDFRISDYIENILQKGNCFWEFDKLIPDSEKSKI